MFDHEQGRPEARAPDPDDTHYRISETTHLNLRMLAATLRGLATLADRIPDAPPADFSETDAAPIFWLLADYTERLIEDGVLVMARRQA